MEYASFFFTFILVSLFLQGRSQTLCSSSQKCYEDCYTDSTTDACCILELPSVLNPTTYPLGYQLYFLPGVDSNDPAPCVRIEFPVNSYTPTTNINYLVFAVETSGTNLCVREANTLDSPTCGSSAIFFCMSVEVDSNKPYVELDLFCQDSCEAVDSSLFMKAVISTLQNEDEYFCDNNSTISLPSSLNQVPTDIFNPPPMTTEASASIPSSLSVLTFLTLSAILMKYVLL